MLAVGGYLKTPPIHPAFLLSLMAAWVPQHVVFLYLEACLHLRLTGDGTGGEGDCARAGEAASLEWEILGFFYPLESPVVLVVGSG